MQTTKTTADILLNSFIFKYGIPARLLYEQGQTFGSAVIQEMCKVLNIDKVRTSVYHPRCNGASKRYKRSILSMSCVRVYRRVGKRYTDPCAIQNNRYQRSVMV